MQLQTVETYVFERLGVSDFDGLRKRLFEELRLACSDVSESISFEGCLDVESFVVKMFCVTKRDTQFWLDTKPNFLGNEKIVNFVNARCKSLNVFHLGFLRDLYWTADSDLSTPAEKRFFESESIQYGHFGEAWLLKHLNDSDENFYAPSGRLCVRSVPCIGATPDYLVLERSSSVDTKRMPNAFEYVEKATGVGEVKTTLTPDGFEIDGGGSIEESDLQRLIVAAVKNRHLFSGSKVPDVFEAKKDGSSKVNWLPRKLTKILLSRYAETCEIKLEEVASGRCRTFEFGSLRKKLYVNFLTSDRGKQLLGQALVFRDNNRCRPNNVNVSAFYLYLNREDRDLPEYCLKLRFDIPVEVLDHIELEVNRSFYSEYCSRCGV
jgi:hypothetical protein